MLAASALSTEAFDAIRELIGAVAGIAMTAEKEELVKARLALQDLGADLHRAERRLPAQRGEPRRVDDHDLDFRGRRGRQIGHDDS